MGCGSESPCSHPLYMGSESSGMEQWTFHQIMINRKYASNWNREHQSFIVHTLNQIKEVQTQLKPQKEIYWCCWSDQISSTHTRQCHNEGPSIPKSSSLLCRSIHPMRAPRYLNFSITEAPFSLYRLSRWMPSPWFSLNLTEVRFNTLTSLMKSYSAKLELQVILVPSPPCRRGYHQCSRGQWYPFLALSDFSNLFCSLTFSRRTFW